MDDAGDTCEPVEDQKPGDGEGWSEGVEAGAARRLQKRGRKRLSRDAALAFALESGGLSCNRRKTHVESVYKVVATLEHRCCKRV